MPGRVPGIHVLLSLHTSQKEDVDGRDEGPVGSAQENGNQDDALHLYVPFRVSVDHVPEGHPCRAASRWKKSGDPLSCFLIAAPLY